MNERKINEQTDKHKKVKIMDWIIDWLKPEQALSKTRLSTSGLCKISLNLNLEGNTKERRVDCMK